MSKQLIDKLIQEAYGTVIKRKVNKLARQRVDAAGLHLIQVTRKDIYDLLVYNYVAIKRPKLITAARKGLKEEAAVDQSRAAAAERVIENDTKIAKDLRDEALKVSNLIFDQLVKTYNKGITDVAYHAVQESIDSISVLQPRNQADKLKDSIVELLKSTSVGTILNSLTTGKALKSFTRRSQFLHLGKTVGVQIVEDIQRAAIGGASGLDDKTQKAAIRVLEKMLSNISFEWQENDSLVQRNIQVVGRIGQTLANKPGQESTDWKVLRPALEEEMFKELQNVGGEFATREGSQPFDERLAKSFLNDSLLKPLAKNKRIKTTPFKTDKPKNNTKKRPTKTASNTKGGRLKKSRRSKIVEAMVAKGVSASPLELIVMLNKQLPKTVQKNMIYPALQNRTGRFASSVRVTDVQITAQGFPSIGYTYDTQRYQTFETGFAQGSVDRDPRKLIDKSIREIAAEFAIGRFYTRRV